MQLDTLIESAASNGASDLHLESGMPAAMRIRGALRIAGEAIAPKFLVEAARELLGAEQWPVFLERRSFDLSRTIRGVRCQTRCTNVFHGRRAWGYRGSGALLVKQAERVHIIASHNGVWFRVHFSEFDIVLPQ